MIGRISIENENNDAVLPIKELKEVRYDLNKPILFYGKNAEASKMVV